MVQILHHEFRTAALRQREDAGAVGLVDVALGRSLHPVQGEEGVGHRLHIVHGPGEQQVVRVHQTRHHLEIAAGLAVVVEGYQCQMPRQIFLRRAQSHPLTVPCEGRDPLLLVEHPAYGIVRALEQPDGGAERLTGLAAADAEAGEGVAPAYPHAGLLQPHQRKALAAHAHVPADVKEQVIHGQIGINSPLLRALIGKGRGHAEEIPGLHLRDVAGEGDPQQIVGPSPDGLALGHGLLTLVVVPQPLPVGTDSIQKVRHRPGQSFLRQRPGANVVLFQIRKPPRSQKPAGMFRRAPVSPRSGGSLGPALYDFLR